MGYMQTTLPCENQYWKHSTRAQHGLVRMCWYGEPFRSTDSKVLPQSMKIVIVVVILSLVIVVVVIVVHHFMVMCELGLSCCCDVDIHDSLDCRVRGYSVHVFLILFENCFRLRVFVPIFISENPITVISCISYSLLSKQYRCRDIFLSRPECHIWTYNTWHLAVVVVFGILLTKSRFHLIYFTYMYVIPISSSSY